MVSKNPSWDYVITSAKEDSYLLNSRGESLGDSAFLVHKSYTVVSTLPRGAARFCIISRIESLSRAFCVHVVLRLLQQILV